MRYYLSKNETPYFAHVSTKVQCLGGRETPAHLCLKRGLHSIGFETEVADDSGSFIWDAVHHGSNTSVEVVCSGLQRYRRKIDYAHSIGMRCWWLLDSAARGLCSQWGKERFCLESFRQTGVVTVEGLFQPKIWKVFSEISNSNLFAFYVGLVWACEGGDRWRLLDASHPLSKAACADDGMKHLMIKMRNANAHAVSENMRRGVNRKTWFDSTFRFREKLPTHWQDDRDYVVETIGHLVRSLKDSASESPRRPRKHVDRYPSSPVHADVGDILNNARLRHSVSLAELNQLKRIASESRVTTQLTAIEIVGASASPRVIADDDRRAIVQPRRIRSSRWRGGQQLDSTFPRATSLQNVNADLQQIANEGRLNGARQKPTPGSCCCSPFVITKSVGKVVWNECVNCKCRSDSWVLKSVLTYRK
jgi:hypothetical protein